MTDRFNAQQLDVFSENMTLADQTGILAIYENQFQREPSNDAVLVFTARSALSSIPLGLLQARRATGEIVRNSYVELGYAHRTFSANAHFEDQHLLCAVERVEAQYKAGIQGFAAPQALKLLKTWQRSKA